MKNTYYKLNREKLEELDTGMAASWIDELLFLKVLEEVQEESQGMSIKSRHLLDNMFGNPLEQVDSMIEGTMKMKNNCTCSGVLLEHCLTKPVYNHHKNCNL